MTRPSAHEVLLVLHDLREVRDLPDDHPDRQAAIAAKRELTARILLTTTDEETTRG